MSEAERLGLCADGQRRRTRQQGRLRSCRVAISVDECEHAELELAARAEGLTVSAFVAERSLAAARHAVPRSAGPLREALAELIRATVQVQKVGTNLNQAVVALNSTGTAPENLVQYARYVAKVVWRLDQIAERVRQQIP